MKKLIITAICVCILVMGMSGAIFASDIEFDVDSIDFGGLDYNAGIKKTFNPGTYEFTVANGAWNKFVGIGGHWIWSVNIYNSATGQEYVIGDHTSYASREAALNAHLNDDPVAITIGSSSEYLSFYVGDTNSTTNDNYGAVTVGLTDVTVVPEPISYVLFIVGGIFIAGRKYLKANQLVIN